ncbi:MAG: flagellar biosynthesis anti-sigma factor FlgM [Gammaproteobacteria bacterium]|jgi:negative regulator of flagellin synthesis FlgM
MTEKIGNLPRPTTETRTSSNQTAGGVRHAETGKHAGGQSSDSSDAISLTDTATRLKSIEARIQELPEVDRERVEEIRRQIDAGEFLIDSKLIAQRIVQLERSLT